MALSVHSQARSFQSVISFNGKTLPAAARSSPPQASCCLRRHGVVLQAAPSDRSGISRRTDGSLHRALKALRRQRGQFRSSRSRAPHLPHQRPSREKPSSRGCSDRRPPTPRHLEGGARGRAASEGLARAGTASKEGAVWSRLIELRARWRRRCGG